MTAPSPPKVEDAIAPPPGNPRFPLLDSLRGLAAISVLVFHAGAFAHAGSTVPGRVAAHLDIGVTLFFLLSGFLLYRPLIAARIGAGPPVRIADFYIRRILRIVPAFWVATTVLGTFALISLADPLGLPSFAFLQVYDREWARSGIAPGWSVAVEASFYLLLPLCMLFGDRIWRRVREKRLTAEFMTLVTLAVASLALRQYVQGASDNPFATDALPTIFAWFTFGMALAVVSLSTSDAATWFRSLAARRQGWFWVAAFCLFLLSVRTPEGGIGGPLWLFVLYGIVSFLILAPATVVHQHDGRPVSRFLRTPALAWLGLVSYGVYLYHYPIMDLLQQSLGGTGVTTMLILTVTGLAAAITCGALSYYLVERHVLRLKGRLTSAPEASSVRVRDRASLPDPAPAVRRYDGGVHA